MPPINPTHYEQPGGVKRTGKEDATRLGPIRECDVPRELRGAFAEERGECAPQKHLLRGVLPNLGVFDAPIRLLTLPEVAWMFNGSLPRSMRRPPARCCPVD